MHRDPNAALDGELIGDRKAYDACTDNADTRR